MKVLNAVLPLLCATVASSASLYSGSSQSAITDEGPSVPGENPLHFCQDPSDYILQVESVNLSPNPPVPGQKLTVTANGTVTKQVEDGAKVFLQVRYGLITLIKQEVSACEQLPKIDVECPIKEGFMSITKDVDIPAQVPPGRYNVLAHATSVDGEDLTCMQASVVFSVHH